MVDWKAKLGAIEDHRRPRIAAAVTQELDLEGC